MQKLESSNKMLNGQTGWLVLPEVNMTKREPNFEVVEMYQNKTKYWNGQNVSDNKILKWSICIWQQNIEMVNMYLTTKYWNGRYVFDKKILKWSKCMWQKDIEMVKMYVTKRYWNGQNVCDKKILKWSKCMWQKYIEMVKMYVTKRY